MNETPSAEILREQRNRLVSYYLLYHYEDDVLAATVQEAREVLEEMQEITDMSDEEILEALVDTYDMEEHFLSQN